jgi:hypothetical protein
MQFATLPNRSAFSMHWTPFAARSMQQRPDASTLQNAG